MNGWVMRVVGWLLLVMLGATAGAVTAVLLGQDVRQAAAPDRATGVLRGGGARPSFEVVSVRLSPPGAGGGSWGRRLADRFEMKGVTVEQMVMYAYGFGNMNEISGVEGWPQSQRFDIEAKVGEAEVAALSRLSRDDWDEQMRLRLQSLLAERFKLSVDFPKKELPVYVLTVARGGFKCSAAKPGSLALALGEAPRYPGAGTAPPPPPPPPGAPLASPGAMLEEATPQQGQHWISRGWAMWFLVTVLRNVPELGGRVVIDRTGLDGYYDCDLSWTPVSSDVPGPTFFTALQEQVGLKVAPAKELVETVQVLSVQRPSEN